MLDEWRIEMDQITRPVLSSPPLEEEDHNYAANDVDSKDGSRNFYLTSRRSSNPNFAIVIGIALFALGVGAAFLIISQVIPEQLGPDKNAINFNISKSPLGVYRFAAVAADAGKCSQIATDVLARGGHAVDAAIAACICTSVYNIHNAGIGGGFLMTIWDNENQKAYAVDARETAPLHATRDMFNDGKLSSLMGGSAIAVPGEVAGYWEVHKKFGRYSWKQLFEPTIEICNEGFKINAVVESAVDEILFNINQTEDPSVYKDMTNFLTNPQTGRPYRANEVMKCPVLAETFRRIGEEGGHSFYNGSLAKDILKDLKQYGSLINETDLQIYRVEWREPLSTWVQGKYRLVSVPPPGSGPVLAVILNILAGYNMTNKDSQSYLAYHRIVEAMKFAYGQRMHLGDESFVPNMKSLVAKISSPSFGDYLRSLINDSTTHPTEYYMNEIQDISNFGTSHISLVDVNGNSVSVTSTINRYFGGAVLGNRTGIVFNNEMDDFSIPNRPNSFNIPPSPSNFIEKGKRPMSSMCPSVILVRDETTNRQKVNLVVGAAGGSRITSGTAYTATRMLWFGENPKQAIDALRLHHQLIPEKLYFEPGMPKGLLSDLKTRGHVNQTEYDFFASILSVVQAVQVLSNGTILANSDFRKNSSCDGY